ncbi:hypothetical protein HY57_17250 [Dyella japonica A8]|uniref:histidine kinase n=1 Tax=Dyella japonica A8 TaxID=1217721 RepID=A0A075K3S2_9GAMM|nr:hypothetical protein HY57_17250 [Dyella japonica A8]
MADWNATSPPTSGWTPVRLPDIWTTRWPTHDGVVWYRLRWHQAQADAPVGLLLDYVCLADAVYLNGSLIHRDTNLVEPLSRSWIKPQYFLIDRPLLHQGENELLVRVSGLAAYQPAFGSVTVGSPPAVEALQRTGLRWRYDCQLFNLAVGGVLGSLFGIFWLFRRQDVVYGWYAFSALVFAAYSYNFIAYRIWPFATTDGWQALNAALYFASASGFVVFLLRYCGRRKPSFERTLLVLNVVALACALAWPERVGPHRNALVVGGGLLYYTAIFVFIVHAARTRRTDQRMLAACLLIPVLTSGHDFLLFFGVIRGDTYLLALTSPLTLIGMSSVLAHRFAAAVRRVENFNVELRLEVEVATRDLSSTLAREHALALTNTRIGERLNLVRDLHDGFGGSLLSTIATLEQSPPTPETARIVATLKELRDDLRLIIDTTTQEQSADLAGLVAPLRHRWSQRMDVAGVASHWRLEGVEQLHLGPARSLDVLRFLQEALTNVLKHSGASKVELVMRRDPVSLRAEVRDDGCGFDTAAHAQGMGLASLRARAQRLGAMLELRSAVGEGTTVSLEVPLHESPPVA